MAQLGKQSARNAGHLGSIPGLGRSPGEGKGYPFQYSGLESSMVHGVTKSQTQLLCQYHTVLIPVTLLQVSKSRSVSPPASFFELLSF